MDVRRIQEVDAAACHALMMRKQEELMQRLHKAEEALQHSARDCILCRRLSLAFLCTACSRTASRVMRNYLVLSSSSFAQKCPHRSMQDLPSEAGSTLTCMSTSKAASRDQALRGILSAKHACESLGGALMQ